MSRKSYGGVDWFRLPAAFLVIAIHTAPFADVNPWLDPVITYGIGRVAVPFFLMVTGYFVLGPWAERKGADQTPVWKYLKKTGKLYALATLIYVPVICYAGKLPDSPWDLLKMLLFDGTWYHLWYFPAVILGCLLVMGLLMRLDFGKAFLCTGVLYLAGLFGDSYYGIISGIPALTHFYDLIFTFSDYTRNGIFYTPLFLLMGAGLARRKPAHWTGFHSLALGACTLALCLESAVTYWLKLQRHNSMYLTLPAVMWLLFGFLLTRKGKAPDCLRKGTLTLYIMHPFVILLVRLAARVFRLEAILVEQSVIHYLAVCLGTCVITAACLYMKGRWRRWQKKAAHGWN